MENEVKQRNQRNRRRERAQRMQAQRESKVKDGDNREDESPARERPPRPPTRRKKSKEPLGEEDIIDGFAIMAFRSYEDLEAAIKTVTSSRTGSLSTKQRHNNSDRESAALPKEKSSTPANNIHGITLLHDAGTSDDSGRASERLTSSSVAQRDPDSSRDRLSDASSRCSSGKGYICDSEDEDEKASPQNSRDGSPKYHDSSMEEQIAENATAFKSSNGGPGGAAGGGALAISRAPVGGSASPAPAPLPHPAPSPAPAALPPASALPTPPYHASPALPSTAATGRPDASSPTPAPPAPSTLYSAAAYPTHPAMPTSAQAARPPHDHAAPSAHVYTPNLPTQCTQANLPTSTPTSIQTSAHQQHLILTQSPKHTSTAILRNQNSYTPQVSYSNSILPPSPIHNTTTPIKHSHTNYSIANHINTTNNNNHSNNVTNTSPYNNHPPNNNNSYTPINNSHIGHTLTPQTNILNTSPTNSEVTTNSIALNLHSNNITTTQSNISTTTQLNYTSNSQISTYANSIPSNPVVVSIAATSFNNNVTSYSNSISTSHIKNITTSYLNSSPVPKTNSTPTPFMNSTIVSHSNNTTAPYPNNIITSQINSLTSPYINSTQTSHVNMANPYPHSTPVSHSNSIGAPYKHSLQPPTHNINSITTAHPAPNLSHSISNHINETPQSTASSMVQPNSLLTSLGSSLTTTSVHNISSINSSQAIDSRLKNPVNQSFSLQPTVSTATTILDQHTKTSNISVQSSTAPNGFPPPHAYSNVPYPTLYAPYAPNSQYLPTSIPSSPRNLSEVRTLSSSPQVGPKTPKTLHPQSISAVVTQTSHITNTHPYSPKMISPATPVRERESFSVSSLSRGASNDSTSSVPLAPTASALPTIPVLPTVPSIAIGGKPSAHWGIGPANHLDRSSTFTAPSPLFPAPLAPPPPPQPPPPSSHNPHPFSAESLFQTNSSAEVLRRELDSRFLAAAGGGAGVSLHHHQHTHLHHHPHHTPPHPLLHPLHHHPHPHLLKDMSKLGMYRTAPGIGYGYSPGLLAPPPPAATLMPHAFTQKPVAVGTEPPNKLARPQPAKSGKWNAMHVRIAWEIYNHQQKEKVEKDKRGPVPHYAPRYDLHAPYLGPPPHLGIGSFNRGMSGVSGLSNVGGAPPAPPVSVATAVPPGVAWDIWRNKPAGEARREAEERERARREREDRERRERAKLRPRSPPRNGELKEAPRPLPTAAPPPLAAQYGPPPLPYDPYRYDPLRHMGFAPFLEATIRAEQDRAKLLSAYASHPQMKMRPPPHHLPPLGGPLPPSIPLSSLAPLAPLDQLKKEEPR